MNARLVEIESQAEQDWILSINALSLSLSLIFETQSDMNKCIYCNDVLKFQARLIGM